MNANEQKLRGIDHFSKLDQAALATLVEESEFTTYDADEVILDPKTPRAGFTFLIEGRWWMSPCSMRLHQHMLRRKHNARLFLFPHHY